METIDRAWVVSAKFEILISFPYSNASDRSTVGVKYVCILKFSYI